MEADDAQPSSAAERTSAMMDVIADAPVLMQRSERLLLYGLVVGLRPARSLEIGTHKGGSAMIIVAALDEVGAGTLVCIDPAPVVDPAHWQRIAHRATLLEGSSPEVLEPALAMASGHFDFALIDGDHAYPGVMRDIEGVLPVLADDAYVLFHDAHFRDVRGAIDQALLLHRRELIDCGMLSVQKNVEIENEVVWGGFRLLRFTRRGSRARVPAGNGAQQPTSAGDLAEVISEATGLAPKTALQAARGLVDRSAYPIDYVAECRALWKEPDRQFVAGLYRLLLGRELSGAESAPYIGMLVTGESRLDVVRAIGLSDEARSRGLPTSWIDSLDQLSDTFPQDRGLLGSWRRKLTSWVRQRPRLAWLARYVVLGLRLPFRSERIYMACLEQQRQLAEQRRDIQDLATIVRALAEDRSRSVDPP
jgi:predicted O-methyltransferase YrrM